MCIRDRFGVGRSTIREAVKSLVTKGVLEVKRGSGTYVRSCLLYTSIGAGIGTLWNLYMPDGRRQLLDYQKHNVYKVLQ